MKIRSNAVALFLSRYATRYHKGNDDSCLLEEKDDFQFSNRSHLSSLRKLAEAGQQLLGD